MLMRRAVVWNTLVLGLLSGGWAISAAEPEPLDEEPKKSVSIDELQGETSNTDASETNAPGISTVNSSEQDVSLRPTYYNGALFTDSQFHHLQIGTYGGDNTGIENGFMSVEGRGGLFANGGNSAFFLDGRFLLNEYTEAGTNLGGGFRHFLSGANVVVGTNAYYDYWDTGFVGFEQFGTGIEVLGPNWELRSNGYIPLGKRRHRIGPSIGFVVGNDILRRKFFQGSLGGFDIEYGRLLWTGDNSAVKGFGGTYFYEGKGSEDGFGVRARGELKLGSATSLNVSLQNDPIFDTTAMFGLEFTFPERNRYQPSFPQSAYNRLSARVHRTSNIAVTNFREISDSGFDAFFIQENTAGAGSPGDPYSLTQLSNDPRFTAGDFVFLMQQGGPITGNIVLDEPNQRVFGSADSSGTVTTLLSDGTIFTQSGLGGRPDINGQILATTSAQASGFNIASANSIPLLINGLGANETVTIDSVNVLDSNDDGIQINDSSGEVQFLAGTNGGLIQDVPGDGIQATGDVNVTLDNVVFNNVGENAIRTNYTGTFIGTGNTVINNPGANGIFLSNNVSTFQFENLQVTGGENALNLAGFTGDFTVTGDAVFTGQSETGILHPAAAVGNTSNLSFGSLTIDNENGQAIALQNHDGTFNVDGAAVLRGTEAMPLTVGLLSDQSTTDFSFGSLQVDNSEKALSIVLHRGQFAVENDTVIDDYRIFGLESDRSSTNFNFGSLSLTAGNSDANGIFLNESVSIFQSDDLQITGGRNALNLADFTGDLTVTGDTVFTGQSATGILHPAAGVGNTSNLSFGSLTIDNENGFAVALENHDGTFNVDGAAVLRSTETLPVAIGILSDQSTTDFTFGSLQVDNSGKAVALVDHTGEFTVQNDAVIDNYRILGLESDSSSTNFNFGSVSVTNGDGTAVTLADHNGVFNVTNQAIIDNYAILGIEARNSSTDFDIGSLSITDGESTAVALENHNGSFEVRNQANIDGYRVVGLLVRNSTLDLSFGDLNVSNGQGLGIALEGNTGDFIVQNNATLNNNPLGGFLARASSSGDYGFGSLGISQGGSGYGVTLDDHSGSFTVDGAANFDNSGQWGIQARNSQTDFQFGSLNVADASVYGVALEGQTGDFTVSGDTSFTNASQYGLLSRNTAGNIQFGSLSTSNTTQYAVGLDNHNGSFTVDGDADLANVGNYGILSTGGSTGDLQFGSLDITGASFVGLSVENGTGDVNVAGDANIDGGNFGLQILNRTGDIGFGSLQTANNRYIGAIFENTTGNIEVTNDFVATNVGQGWFIDKAVQVSNTSGSVTFGSLAVDGNGILGLDYRNNQNGLSIAGTETNGGFESSGFINGMSAIGNSGDMTFGDVTVTGEPGSGTGMLVQNNNGNVTIDGDATFTDLGGDGASFINITGNVEMGNLTASNTTLNGLLLSNVSGGVTIDGDVNMTNPGQFGLFVNNVGGDIAADNVDIDGANAAGIQITNTSGDFSVEGDTTIQNTHQGIALNNTTTDLNLENLTITKTTGNGLSLFQSTSDVTVSGTAVFDDTGASAILSDGDSSGDLQFASLDIDTNSAIGVSLNDHSGDFTVDGTADFDNAGGSAFLAQGDSSGDYSFGSIDVDGSGTSGIGLVDHSGDFTVLGDTNINGSSIALQVNGGSGDMVFDGDVDIDSPGMTGISLFDGSKNVTANGSTTITSPGAIGLLIRESSGSIEFDELNVSDPGSNGVTMALFDGDLTISGGEISGISSGHQAVFKHDSGNGSVSLSDMTFLSNADDVFGLVTLEYGNGGAATLNDNEVIFADGSTGTIGYRFGSFETLGAVVNLSGTGNTTTNAVQSTQFDTFAPSFNGTVEIDGTDVPTP